MATTNTMSGLPAYSEHASQHGNNSNNNNHSQENLTTGAEDAAHLEIDINNHENLPPYPDTPPRSRSISPSSITRTPLPSIVQEKAALAALYDSHSKNNNNNNNHHHSTIDLSSPSPSHASASAPIFSPTSQLHIQHAGKPWLSLPLPQRPDPIPILAVDSATGQVVQGSEAAVYVSVRPERRSGSCFLVSGGAGGIAAAAGRSLTSTTYRFGPGNPPLVSLGLAAANVDDDDDDKQVGSNYNDNRCADSHHHQRQQKQKQKQRCEEKDKVNEKELSFQVKSKGMATRAVEFETGCFFLPSPSPSSQPADTLTTTTTTTTTRRGDVQNDKFTWRYAGSRERAALVPCSNSSSGSRESSKSPVNSLLILERTTTTTTTTTTKTTPTAGPVIVVGEDGKYDGGSGSGSVGSSKNEVYTTAAEEEEEEEEGTVKGVGMLGRFAAWRTRTKEYSESGQKKTDPAEHDRSGEKTSSSNSGSGNSRTQIIAMLVRSDDLRSPGSSASAAGNGGRLFLDLRSFAADSDDNNDDHNTHGGNDQQEDGSKSVGGGVIDGGSGRREELARQMVVTTALVMLKREVDRRRAAQIAIMCSGGGGGG